MNKRRRHKKWRSRLRNDIELFLSEKVADAERAIRESLGQSLWGGDGPDEGVPSGNAVQSTRDGGLPADAVLRTGEITEAGPPVGLRPSQTYEWKTYHTPWLMLPAAKVHMIRSRMLLARRRPR